MKQANKNRGFVAFTAVILAVGFCATVVFSSLNWALNFYDFVHKDLLRIQARLNSESCLELGSAMYAKDYFIKGQFFLKEFDCTLNIENDFQGEAILSAKAKSGDVTEYGSRYLVLTQR